jgi:hypothetical protein
VIYGQPANGITDSEHYVFRADAATYAGPPTEKNELDRTEWIPLVDIRGDDRSPGDRQLNGIWK